MNNGPAAGPAAGLVCCFFIFGFAIALFFSAAILMVAVGIANKCLPQSAGREDPDDYRGDWNSYERLQRRIGGPAIPSPTFGWAMIIVFVTLIIQFGVGFAMGIAAGAGAGGKMPNQQAMLTLQCFSMIVGFFVGVGLRGTMLPTSLGRAFLVSLFEGLIWFAITVAIVVALLAAGVAMPALK